MSAAGVAIGSSILSGLISAGAGIAGLIEGEKAKKQQAEALSRIADLTDEQMQMFKEKIASVEGIFGPIEKNLANYYSSLDPASVAARDIQNIEQEFARISTDLNTQMARRGLLDSGIAQANQANLAQNLAYARAEARSAAPQKVVEQQSEFAKLGQQRLAPLYAGLQNAYGQKIGLEQTKANLAGSALGNANNAVAQGFAGLGNAISQGLSGYFVGSALDDKTHLSTPPTTTPPPSTQYASSDSILKPEYRTQKSLQNYNWLDKYLK